jgi:acyl transferase domain-containing protein
MMFSGQGTQYVNMGRELYNAEPFFRQQVDLCLQKLDLPLGYDLREVLYPGAGPSVAAALPDLNQTCAAQPALFIVEYALARLWMEWGVIPEVMIGHSVGEYVAACLAGVMTLEDALSLVSDRGRLTQQLPAGGMLALLSTEEEACRLIEQHEGLSLAAVNSPHLCVVSGPAETVGQFEACCEAQGVDCRRLRTSHAFHSGMVEAILDEFTARVRKVHLKPPQIPFISNVTGTWITAMEAIDPDYWARHLRRTVRFLDGVILLSEKPERVMLEVGPGETLCSAVRQIDGDDGRLVLPSLKHPRRNQSDVGSLLDTLGKLWVAGKRVDWRQFYAHERRRRTVLPTYPFERQRYWVELNRHAFGLDEHRSTSLTPEDVAGMAARDQSAPDASSNYVAPASQIERTIAGIWQELFGIERVGVHDNFFDLGGNSLVGIQLMSRMRKVFMAEIPMNALFESPTVAGLAGVVSEIHLKEKELEQVEQLISEIEYLSPEELELRLSTGDRG